VSLLAAGCIGVVLVLLFAALFGVLGVGMLFEGGRASWLPGLLLLVVCAVVAWLAIMGARGVFRWFRKPAAPCDVGPPPLPGICPVCGEADLYRAAGSTVQPWSIFTARCVGCASRFRVPRRLWIALPETNPGAAHETYEDRVQLAARTPLSFTRFATFVGLMLAAAALAGVTAASLARVWPVPGVNQFMLPWLVLSAVAWRLWVYWWPPPSRPSWICTKCGYNLKACAEPRRPECGTQFDLDLLRWAASPDNTGRNS